MDIIRNYFQKTRRYSAIRFIFELTLVAKIGQVLSGLIGFGIASFFVDLNIDDMPTRFSEDQTSPVFTFLLVCVVAPIFETVISQWLPIKVLQKITSSTYLIIIIDATLFAIFHWSFGFIYMTAILPTGIIYAWSWIVYKNSFSRALCMTASIHGLCNFSALVSIFYL